MNSAVKIGLIGVMSAMVGGLVVYFLMADSTILSPLGRTLSEFVEDRPLEEYSFTNLAARQFAPQIISLESVLAESPNYTSHLFSIAVDGQKVTGQLNLPTGTPPKGGFPVVLLNRGYIDPAVYQTGMGTKNVANTLATNGFVTIAPDYLGYGGSDKEDIDPMAARVKRPLTPLTILYSLDSLNQFVEINPAKIFMWGHSNGGQISLSVLEILGQSPYWQQPIPTSLWAPVTAAFPYNILYYTDDFADVGKALRQVLYNFELKYDTHEYSIHSYLEWIDSPIQIHQGTADDLTPTAWSDRIVRELEEREKTVTYYRYPGADHNLQPDWNQAVARDLQYFRSFLESE